MVASVHNGGFACQRHAGTGFKSGDLNQRLGVGRPCASGEIAWPVTVYPNPASSSISFGLLPTGGNGLVVLKDMVGRQVLNSAIDLASGNTKLDVSQLQPAVYLVQLIEKGKVVFSGKVVLIR